ncbi:MAG: HD domain-containing phosphohydrolase [Acidobacteriota bacterium]
MPDRLEARPASAYDLTAGLPVEGEAMVLRRRLADVEKLLTISGEIAQTLDLDRLLDLALVRAEEVCRAETSSIWELDEDRQELFFRVVRGRAAPGIRGLRVPLGEGLVGDIAATGRPEIVNRVESDPRWRGEPMEGFITRSILTVPLQVHGRTVGVMQLLNPVDDPADESSSEDSGLRAESGFTTEDLWRMRLFAGPLAQAIENARLYAARRRQFYDTVATLAEATERRDPYTGGHASRVVAYSLLLGREMALSDSQLEELMLTATLHDVGKLSTPDAILRKPAPLTDEERVIMRRHPDDGAEMLSRIHDLRHVVPAVRAHHEWVDGSGYPRGLCGDEIPRSARIVAVADAFDAMTTHRPYRQGCDGDTAARHIIAGAGSQFCSSVVAAFERLYDGNRWLLAHGRLLAQGVVGSP